MLGGVNAQGIHALYIIYYILYVINPSERSEEGLY